MTETPFTARIMQGQVEPAPIIVAPGDGIGPEIMAATLAVMEAAGASLDLQPIEIGEAMYRRGYSSGISPDTWQYIRERKVILKGPITTPQGSGVKSLNVTLRKTLGLYANVRPVSRTTPTSRSDTRTWMS
jgi:isocitrate dehydrogenase